jgi:hypothetical protein
MQSGKAVVIDSALICGSTPFTSPVPTSGPTTMDSVRPRSNATGKLSSCAVNVYGVVCAALT